MKENQKNILKNKGKKLKLTTLAFTLIELLGVIIILGLLGLIVYPNVTKAIRNSKEKLYQRQVDLILTAARNYKSQNEELFFENENFQITPRELVSSGYLNKVPVSPRDEEEMDGCASIVYEEGNQQYVYSYEEVCNEKPNIIINGQMNTDLTYTIGIYEDIPKLEVSYQDDDTPAEEIVTRVSVRENGKLIEGTRLDSNTLKTYIITYEAWDQRKHKRQVNVTVDIVSSIVKNVSYVANGGIYNDTYVDVIETTDGGYLALGNTSSPSVGDLTTNSGNFMTEDVMLVKYDSLGNREWTKIYGGTGNDKASKLVQVSDGYVFSITTASLDGDFQAYRSNTYSTQLVKVDFTGNIQKVVSISGFFSWDTPVMDLQVVDHQLYVLYQDYQDVNYQVRSFSLAKFDEQLNLLLKHSYGGADYREFLGSSMVIEEQYVTMVGYAYSDDDFMQGIKKSPLDTKDAFILKVLKEDFSVVKAASFGGSSTNFNGGEFHNIIKADDGYLVSGIMLFKDGDMEGLGTSSEGIYDTVLVKYDSDLNVVWKKGIGGSQTTVGKGLLVVQDEVLVYGYTKAKDFIFEYLDDGTNNTYRTGFFLSFKTSDGSLGKIVTSFGGSSSDSINQMILLKNGNYLFVGDSSSKDGDLRPSNYGNLDAILGLMDSQFQLLSYLKTNIVLGAPKYTMVSNYGSSIPTPDMQDTLKLYTSIQPIEELGSSIPGKSLNSGSNYRYYYQLHPIVDDDILYLSQNATSTYQPIQEGDAYYPLLAPKNRHHWLQIHLKYVSYGGLVSVSKLKVYFQDTVCSKANGGCTITEAVSHGVIEPLVCIGQNYTTSSPSYSWPTLYSLLSGGSTGEANWPEAFILMKPKEGVIEGVSFESSVAPNILYAGFGVQEFMNFDISLSPGK